MSNLRELHGPLVVGGSGGSGTRLIARILLESGVHLGEDLNEELDNVWFTLLLKRPGWRRRVVSDDPTAIDRHLRVLQRAIHEGAVTDDDLGLAATAAIEMSSQGHDHGGSGTGAWPFLRVATMASATGAPPGSSAWGWKEPNSHVYLAELARTFPGLRYVHVVRNGLDVAHGNNHNQMFNWWADFGLDRPDPDVDPAQALRFWIVTNQRAMTLGPELLGDRFVFVNYNAVCASPEREIPRLLGALGLVVDRRTSEQLVRLPHRAPRHATATSIRDHDPRDLAAVAQLGFDVPGSAHATATSP